MEGGEIQPQMDKEWEVYLARTIKELDQMHPNFKLAERIDSGELFVRWGKILQKGRPESLEIVSRADGKPILIEDIKESFFSDPRNTKSHGPHSYPNTGNLDDKQD